MTQKWDILHKMAQRTVTSPRLSKLESNLVVRQALTMLQSPKGLIFLESVRKKLRLIAYSTLVTETTALKQASVFTTTQDSWLGITKSEKVERPLKSSLKKIYINMFVLEAFL